MNFWLLKYLRTSHVSKKKPFPTFWQITRTAHRLFQSLQLPRCIKGICRNGPFLRNLGRFYRLGHREVVGKRGQWRERWVPLKKGKHFNIRFKWSSNIPTISFFICSVDMVGFSGVNCLPTIFFSGAFAVSLSGGRNVLASFEKPDFVAHWLWVSCSVIRSLTSGKPRWLKKLKKNHPPCSPVQQLHSCHSWSIFHATNLQISWEVHHLLPNIHVPSFSIIDYAANPTSDTAYIRVRSRLQHLMVLTDSNLQHMHKNHKHLQQPNRTCTLEASTNWKYLYILENKRELNSKSWLLFTCFHWRQWSIKGFLCEWGHFEKEPLYIISYPFRNTSGTPEWWKLLSTCQATK